MTQTDRRLAESAALLQLLQAEDQRDQALSAEIVDRELRELEDDLRRQPEGCERQLVPVRTRRGERGR